MALPRSNHLADVFGVHSFGATLIIILVPWLAGGAELFSVTTLTLGLFAIPLHVFTFGRAFSLQNRTRDQQAPRAGDTVDKVTRIGLFSTAIVGIVIAYLYSSEPILPLISLVTYLAAVHLYGDLGKSRVLIFIPPAVAFASLAAFGYLLTSTLISLTFFLILAYIFLNTWFQMITSEMVNMDQEGETRFEFMGTKIVAGIFEPSTTLYSYLWGVKVLALLAIWVMYFSELATYGLTVTNLFVTIPSTILTVVGLYHVKLLSERGPWLKDRARRYAVIDGIASILLLPVILLPIVPLLDIVVLISIIILSFLLIRRIGWKIWPPII
ncbi:MAG: hypothetical protein QQN63_07965 [Nitrosopumilus sp.]